MTREEIIEFLSDQLREHIMMYTLRNTYANTLQMFKEYDKITNSYKEAIKLLEDMEPKVMTLSWVLNLKESTPVWLEDVDKKDVIGALFMRDYSGTKCVDFAIVRDWEFERVVADYTDYGVRWRAWTSKPTDEQRQNTPWEK